MSSELGEKFLTLFLNTFNWMLVSSLVASCFMIECYFFLPEERLISTHNFFFIKSINYLFIATPFEEFEIFLLRVIINIDKLFLLKNKCLCFIPLELENYLSQELTNIKINKFAKLKKNFLTI